MSDKLELSQDHARLLATYAYGPRIYDAVAVYQEVLKLADFGLLTPHGDTGRYELTTAGHQYLATMNQPQPTLMDLNAIRRELDDLADRRNNRERRKAKHTWGTEGDRIREDADEARHDALTAEQSARNDQKQHHLGPSGIDPDEISTLVADHVEINNMRAGQ